MKCHGPSRNWRNSDLPPFLLFLDARDDVLLKRFSETRRRHPLGCEGSSLSDAIVANAWC